MAGRSSTDEHTEKAEVERLLALKVKTSDNGFGYLFSVRESGGETRWRCHLCDVVIIGREFVDTHLKSKKHQVKVSMPSHSPELFARVEYPKTTNEPPLDLEPGQPCPPGFEDSLKKTTQIQMTLDAMTNPLIGLEYLVELLPEEAGNEPSYICMLCDKRGDPRVVLSHLSSYNHCCKYISIYFPTASRKMNLEFPRNKEGRKAQMEVVQRMCKQIQEKCGRLDPTVMDQEKFNTGKDDLMKTINTGKHFKETDDWTLVEVVDPNILKEIQAKANTPAENPADAEVKATEANQEQNKPDADKSSSDLKNQDDKKDSPLSQGSRTAGGKTGQENSRSRSRSRSRSDSTTGARFDRFGRDKENNASYERNKGREEERRGREEDRRSRVDNNERDLRERLNSYRDRPGDFRERRGNSRDRSEDLRDRLGNRSRTGDFRDRPGNRDRYVESRDRLVDSRDRLGESRDRFGESRDRFGDRDRPGDFGRRRVDEFGRDIKRESFGDRRDRVDDYNRDRRDLREILGRDRLRERLRSRSRSPSGTRRRSRSRGRRSRSRSLGKRSRSRSYGRRSRSPIIRSKKKKNDLKEKWAKFKERAEKLESDLNKQLQFHKKNPEKHPEYPEEWKKFWNRRYRELQAEGKDASKHDFKPEWIIFWNVRMQELHDEKVKMRKDEVKEELGLEGDENDVKEESEDDEVVLVSPLPEKKPEKKQAVTVNDIKNTWREMTGSEIKGRSPSPHREKEKFRGGYSDRYRREDEPVRTIAVLRLLTALENQLGSLGPKVNDLMSTAIAMEKVSHNSSDTMLMDPVHLVMFETIAEKLKGQLFAGIVERNMISATKTCIAYLEELLSRAEKMPKVTKPDIVVPTLPATVSVTPSVPVHVNPVPVQMNPVPVTINSAPVQPPANPVAVPGIGVIDRAAIAQQIATALIAQGRTDVTQEELEELIAAVVGMAEASSHSQQPLTTAAYVAQLQQNTMPTQLQQTTPQAQLQHNIAPTQLHQNVATKEALRVERPLDNITSTSSISPVSSSVNNNSVNALQLLRSAYDEKGVAINSGLPSRQATGENNISSAPKAATKGILRNSAAEERAITGNLPIPEKFGNLSPHFENLSPRVTNQLLSNAPKAGILKKTPTPEKGPVYQDNSTLSSKASRLNFDDDDDKDPNIELSEKDLKTLLSNFKDLVPDQQHKLIQYLKKLENTEPERVERLRAFVTLDVPDTRHGQGSGRLSPFSSRAGGINPSVEDDHRNFNMEESDEDDDYSYEDIYAAASRTVQERELENKQKRELEEEKKRKEHEEEMRRKQLEEERKRKEQEEELRRRELEIKRKREMEELDNKRKELEKLRLEKEKKEREMKANRQQEDLVRETNAAIENIMGELPAKFSRNGADVLRSSQGNVSMPPSNYPPNQNLSSQGQQQIGTHLSGPQSYGNAPSTGPQVGGSTISSNADDPYFMPSSTHSYGRSMDQDYSMRGGYNNSAPNNQYPGGQYGSDPGYGGNYYGGGQNQYYGNTNNTYPGQYPNQGNQMGSYNQYSQYY